MPDLTVITATCRRPAWLANCLEQFARQQFSGLTAEQLIVSDGPDSHARNLAKTWGANYVERPVAGGRWGAAARDHGIACAQSDFICLWDDDNIYHPTALQTLWDTGQSQDIGVVRTWYRTRSRPGRIALPRLWNGTFRKGDIDTMCVIVRRTLALKEKWTAGPAEGHGLDYDWLRRLALRTDRVAYRPVIIGWHL